MTKPKTKQKPPIRWALHWHGHKGGHFMWEDLLPLLFTTRHDARMYARAKYGYILARKDLRSPPHNWRLPRPVRVEVVLSEAGNVKR